MESSSQEGIIITDTNWNILFVNPLVQRSSLLKGLLSFEHDLRGGFLSLFGCDPSWHKYEQKIVWAGVSPRCWQIDIIPMKEGGVEKYIRIGILEVTERETLKSEAQAFKKLSAQYVNGQKKNEESLHHFTEKMMQSIKPNVSRITGLTHLLVDSVIDNEGRQIVEAISQHIHNLEYSLRNLSHFKALREKKVPLKRSTFSLRECLDDVMDIFTFITAEKDLDISYWVEETIPDTLLGDKEKIQQVLVNLLDNAIRHTWEGDIIVKVVAKPLTSRAGSASRNIQLVFSVKDSGLGFPQELIEVLCPPLSTEAFRHPMLGMGIPICHHLIQLMGGHLTFDSKEGEGTECLFSMKLGLNMGQQLSYTADVSGLEGKKVLITDDNPINREILSHLASSWNMEVTVTESAESAMEALLDTEIDLLISDMQMPRKNGVALAKEVKKMADIPIILLSSIGSLEEYPDLDELFTCIMEKPVKPPKLLAAVQESLGLPQTFIAKQEVTTEVPLLAEEFPIDILVAEDNHLNQKLILTILNRMGYSPILAQNGMEALGICEEKQVDLVFMDLQMPEMDGLQASKEIRARKGKLSPVIVALTAYAMQEDRERCLEAGMQEHIAKPFRAEEIEQVIRKYSELFLSSGDE